MMYQYQQAALNGYGDTSDQDYVMGEDDTADHTPRAGGGKGRGGGGSRSRRASATGGGGARSAAAANAAAGGGGGGGSGGLITGSRAGIPGKVCCECSATQTPQWREGPKGKEALKHVVCCFRGMGTDGACWLCAVRCVITFPPCYRHSRAARLLLQQLAGDT